MYLRMARRNEAIMRLISLERTKALHRAFILGDLGGN